MFAQAKTKTKIAVLSMATILTAGAAYGVTQSVASGTAEAPLSSNKAVQVDYRNESNEFKQLGHGKSNKSGMVGKHKNASNGKRSGMPAAPSPVQSPTDEKAELSSDIASLLTFLVQEEKMAYDLYTVIGNATGLRQMQNISRSEDRHIEAVRSLLAMYGVDDPTLDLAIGEFEDATLQALYDELLAIGSDSSGAIEVGVAVEETDIKDIEEMLTQDLPTDIKRVLESLLAASYNHLAAFSR